MRRLRFGIQWICILSLNLHAVSALAASETGKFRLHKFEQAIGEESYSIGTGGKSLTVKSTFLFTDRGTKVPLRATLKASADYTPRSFEIKGKTSRASTINSEVRVKGVSAAISENKKARTADAPAKFFTISGYAPVAMQMALIRYWRSHGSPPTLATLPSGEVHIQDRGPESFEIAGRSVRMERYSVRGLIWGLETLWMDADNLAALVSIDAEFDHFEAVREEYEVALPKFVASAARDQMAALTELSATMPGRRTGTLAFIGATLIDGTGKPATPDAVVVTRDGKITAVGARAEVSVPADAQTIDVKGKFIIPGLWDMHAHYEQVEWGPIYLAAGITTVRDVGNEFEFITAVRDAVNSGNALGPHMLLAGVVDGDGPLALGVDRVNSPEDAKTWVNRYHDAGFQQMKIYSSVKADNVKAICADAHHLGMTVTGHIPEGMTAFDGINDGMDQINHIGYVAKLFQSIDVDSPKGREIVQFFKQHNTVLDPTIALTQMFIQPNNRPLTEIEPGAAKVAPELRDSVMNTGIKPSEAAQEQTKFQKSLAVIGALHRAGVRIVAGTDQGVPGYSLYRELELYVRAGFSPMEALQSATLVPAQVMKVGRRERNGGSGQAGGLRHSGRESAGRYTQPANGALSGCERSSVSERAVVGECGIQAIGVRS